LSNLNKEQAEAVKHKDGPCLVLAGPGSGKTFTLVERIKYLIESEGVDPRSILVLTFSKKAALHMQYRFENNTQNRGYPVCFGTFHAVFYSIVKNHYCLNEDSILTSDMKQGILRRVVRQLNLNDHGSNLSNVTNNSTELLNNINNYKSRLALEVDLVNDSTGKPSELFLKKTYSEESERNSFLKIYDEYIKECRKNKKIDFDDMLVMCRDILKADRKLLELYRKLYSYFLVDEFQDINEVQYEVLKMLAGDKCNIFAVGDDDQAIYGFRGSKPEFMQRFIYDYENVRIIDMYKNYRCASSIVEIAGKLILHNKNRFEKRQKACRKDRHIGSVKVECFKDAKDEAEYVVNEIRQLSMNGINDIAVLYRTSKCADALEEMLKNSGIGYTRKTDRNSYYEEEWIRDIFTYFRIALGKDNKELIYRIMNRPLRNLTRDDKDSISYLETLISNLKDMSGFAALTYVLKGLGYEKYYKIYCMQRGISEKDAFDMLEELILKSKQYSSVEKWLDAVDYFSGVRSGEGNRNDINSDIRVQLMTVHASKGLEFEAVFVIGLQEGIFPHRNAVSVDELEEERRLLYVAITRAKSILYIIGRGHEKHGKKISSFVYEISSY